MTAKVQADPFRNRGYFQVEQGLLTTAEIDALRREAKENSAYARKAFVHLRPENKAKT